jgi:hypothetical protein
MKRIRTDHVNPVHPVKNLCVLAAWRETLYMYLHIGSNIYLWSERIIGIYHVSLLQDNPEGQNFLAKAKIFSHNLAIEAVKSCIVTDTHEVYFSKVSCRTLRQRWKSSSRKFP